MKFIVPDNWTEVKSPINWDKSLSKGKDAEAMVLRWLGGLSGYNDILVNFEIKNNWHSGNIFIEEDSIKENGIKGWLYTTKAHSVVFVDYDNEMAVTIEISELRNVYNTIKENYELHEQTTERNGTKWTSTHRQIPVNKFCHLLLKFYQTG